MAMLVTSCILGIDVAQKWLDIYDGLQVIRIDNSDSAVSTYFKSLKQPCSLAVEPTNYYHESLVQFALASGHVVYLVDAYRVSRYREAIGVRAKTDAGDAELLYRYVEAEKASLKPYQPSPKAVKELTELLRARGKLAKTKASMGLYLSNIAALVRTRQALLSRIERAIKLIDSKIERCLTRAGYQADYQRCRGIPGVGPVNAATLVAIYHRGEFRRADSFIAYIGLDVRVRESGKYKGQRKLTKKGNAEVRRLLFNAARAGARTVRWNPYYHVLRSRGLSSTAACVAIARKIAKVAFALMRDHTMYQHCTEN